MVVKNQNVEYEILDAKSRRKILAHDGGLMMVEVTFDKGGIGSVHTHPHEQISYVVRGSFLFDLDGEKVTVKAGDSLYIPSGLPHGNEALEDGVLVDVFTPQREDFLK
ncbi:cupin domain-containing protein [Ructibacterium gallinarum]|uniref:Cupin domain-containing protein n=1 Tax=Ructibacterium gallinarum TaxID=2779355 RepID=A0A9D5LWN5_9FIRM|nr:cupin domain-containing protein [Ructibacterium gallinarum]MBE5039108.1 cupin domain-containing protein [Ructibacterium gallinarum]